VGIVVLASLGYRAILLQAIWIHKSRHVAIDLCVPGRVDVAGWPSSATQGNCDFNDGVGEQCETIRPQRRLAICRAHWPPCRRPAC
jgi:hypothetical protein